MLKLTASISVVQEDCKETSGFNNITSDNVDIDVVRTVVDGSVIVRDDVLFGRPTFFRLETEDAPLVVLETSFLDDVAVGIFMVLLEPEPKYKMLSGDAKELQSVLVDVDTTADDV